MIKYIVKGLSEYSDEELKECFSFMSSERKAKVLRYRNEIPKKSTLAGELSARKLLSEICGSSIETFDISPDQHGKLRLNNQKDLFFNISHSEEKIAVVVSDEEVGIDIEVFRPTSLKLAKRICTEDELLYIFGHIPTDCEYNQSECNGTLRRFFEIWTAKEAYFKCIGSGITDLTKMQLLSSDFKKTKIITDEYVAHIVKISDIK